MSDPAARTPEERRSRAVEVAVTAVAVAALCWFLPPIDRQQSHWVRGLLALAGIGLAWGRFLLPRYGGSEAAARAVWTGLTAALVLGWFNYFQFDPAVLGGIDDYTDTAYYYTNSKYLPELGYGGLYAGALVCDAERGAPRTGDLELVRDLRDDSLRDRDEELVHGAAVKAAFTPARWAGFCHDIDFFLDRLDERLVPFFVDHGYNPPPTWTVIGGPLCHLVDVEHLKWICEVDTALVAVMFGLIGWAFGFEALGFGMLFWVVTYSGRWPILGMAILRFDWVVALVAAVCLLRMNRYGWAGAALAYAAMNRVFPAIFFWGWLVEAALDTARERQVPRKHRRFALAAALTCSVLLGAAAVEYGPQTMLDSAQALKLHNESFSSHRVGLGTVAVWRGEIDHRQISATGGMIRREEQVRDLRWALRGIGVLALAAIAAAAWALARSGRPVPAWELVAWTVAPLYCATTPQVNYYNFRIVSYLWQASDLADRVNVGLITALFGTEVVAQVAQYLNWDRHAVNALTSWGMLIYFSLMVASIALRVGSPSMERRP